jgi:tetratricopeptide (TPR) repeat protein
MARLIGELGRLFLNKSLFDRAEPLLRRALAVDEVSYGDAHPDVAVDLNYLAQLLKATNRLGEAEPLMLRALEIDEARFGAAHPNVARDFNNLAQLLKDADRLAEAEPLMWRALEISKVSYIDSCWGGSTHAEKIGGEWYGFEKRDMARGSVRDSVLDGRDESCESLDSSGPWLCPLRVLDAIPGASKD